MSVFQTKQPSSRQGTTQSLSVSTTSAASTAFGSQTFQVMLVPTALCYVVVGNSPVATTSSTPLPVNRPMYFTCTPGQQVAAITSSGTATLSITELS